MRRFIFYVIFASFQIQIYGDLSNSVDLPNGKKLNGLLIESYHSKKPYVEFRGLRFGIPPLGDFRFHPTRLYDDVWSALSEDATTYGNICPQLDPFYNPDEDEDGSWDRLKVLGDEDCLFANVATSNPKSPNPLPVLVWIHGGNFQSESGQDYGIEKFMDHDIVVVTFNYRIGLLGFFNSEDGVYNGNQGLKDQTVLLQFVKSTVSVFGGDPDKITLAGSNAGAISTHLHLLSDFSKGLFHRAIIQSGTAISPWVITKDNNDRLKNLAKHLKCGNDTDTTTCLEQKGVAEILQQAPKITEWFLDPLVPFGPSVEMFGDTRDRFLAREPYAILSEGNYWGRDIPVVVGCNSHEGLLYAMDIGHQGVLRMVFNMEWFSAAPISLYFWKSAIDARSVSETIRHYYFRKDDEDKGNASVKMVDKNYRFDNLTNLYSDRHFFVPLHHTAKLMGRSNEVYLYWFDYVPEQSIHGLYGYNSSHIFGPSHYDQLQYLFVTPFFNKTSLENHIEFEKRFIKGFYTFVNDGNPFFENWKPVSKEMMEGTEPFLYNRISEVTEPIHIPEPFATRVEFWKGVFLMEYDNANFINDLIQEQESSPSPVQPKVEL